MKLLKCVILSGQGKATFTPEQTTLLESAADIQYITVSKELSKDEFIRQCKNATILAVTRRTTKNLSKEWLSQLPNLKAVALYSTGYEWVDVHCLKQRGVVVNYLPDYSTTTVAEQAMGMILTLSRRIHLAHDKGRKIVDAGVSLRGKEIAGKTLGIIGYGKIGKAVAELATGFSLQIIYYDIDNSVDTKQKSPLSLTQVLNQSDIIVIAASRERDAPPILTKTEFDCIKPGAILVNVARAILVENSALLEAIRSRKIYGYGVDDYIEELLDAPDIEPGRILQTGHTGWYSDEAMARGTMAWVENIIALTQGSLLHSI
ncbi:MAG: D-isomer specific 2-hydroxyacid dehydrogenase family protein [Leptospirales bacterium]